MPGSPVELPQFSSNVFQAKSCPEVLYVLKGDVTPGLLFLPLPRLLVGSRATPGFIPKFTVITIALFVEKACAASLTAIYLFSLFHLVLDVHQPSSPVGSSEPSASRSV